MKRALLIGDLQTGITTNYPFSSTVLPAAVEAVHRARSAGIFVLFAVAALRPSGTDLSARNVVFNQLFDQPEVFHQGGPGPVVDPRFEPRKDEPVIVKRRVSAFHGTELDLVLRSQGVEELAIGGVATGAMVLATALQALDHDYSVSVLSDCCADPDPEVHDFLVNRLFAQRGVSVTLSTTWLP
jgi:nicotinamidase-related amidase